MGKFFLAFILVLVAATSTFAQSPKPSVSPSSVPSVDYVLPYPGILPDNALYKVKMLRDRIGDLIISDPLRKAEYLLKLGDKRVSASKFLADYKKWQLAAETASKGEIYLLRSVEQAEIAKNKGEDVTQFLGKLSSSSLKHTEVIKQMWDKAPDGPKQSLEKSLITTSDVYKKTQGLLGIKTDVAPTPSPFIKGKP